MYIIKLGQSYMADYVGHFETRREALEWLELHDFEPRNCKVIRVVSKSDYLD